MADEQQQDNAETTPENGSGQAVAQSGVTVDDSNVLACSGNFCRGPSTELLLDLGLNPNPMMADGTTVKVQQRIILNHYTAKRLLGALSMALQRHESTFGPVEVDVRKRLRNPSAAGK